MKRKLYPVTVLLTRELRSLIAKAAKDDNRSVSSLVAIIIDRWLNDRTAIIKGKEV